MDDPAVASGLMLGQLGFLLGPEDTIVVARADQPMLLYLAPGQGIFDLLRTKLRWSGSTP